MEIGKKTVAAGIGLFFLGGFSVYLLMANSAPAQPVTSSQATAQLEPAQQIQVTQSEIATTAPAETSEPDEMTHDAFLAQADARREQQLIDKAEADRLEKLQAIKERSVECKFWKQQQKTSSAAAKIEEKIIQHCTVQTSSVENTSSSAAISSSEKDASL